MIAIKGHSGVPSLLRKAIQNFKVNKIEKEIWSFSKKRIKQEIIESTTA